MTPHFKSTEYLLTQIVNAQNGACAIVDISGEYLLKNGLFAEYLLSSGESIDSDKHDVSTIRTPLTDINGVVFAYLVSLPTFNSKFQERTKYQEPLIAEQDQFSVLNSLLANMLTYQKLDPLLQSMSDIVIEVTEADNALILMVDETEEYLHVVASAGPMGKKNIGKRREYGVGFAGIAWSTKESQYLQDCEENDATKGFWPAGSQLVAVPLIPDDKVIGVVVLVASAHCTNFRTSTGMVEPFVSLASLAIVNAKSRELNELELSHMRALREINVLLGDFENTAKLIQSVSKTIMNAMDISRVVYFAVEDDGVTEHADIWAKRNGIISKGESILEHILAEGINGWVYRNNEPAFLPRNHEDTRESIDARAKRKAANIGSTFTVPITSTDRVVGVISISRDVAKRDLNENERNLFISICSQISSALLNRELSVALKHRAFHDSLTELPNRYCFERELEADLEALKESHSTKGAVLFLDLDGFKSVNDSLGHHYGDELLGHVADRFKSCLNKKDTIARVGGDEFAIISRDIASTAEAVSIASRLIESLRVNFDINGVRVKIGASIGLSFFPQDGHNAETLIRNADEAMYRAKANGKGQIICFDQAMADESKRRVQLESELRDAVKHNRFVLYFQPQVHTYTGEVSSVEALIRWQHSERGFISPGEFIPIAEEAGLVNTIGNWVLEESVKLLASWRGGPLDNIRIGVNVAASQVLEEFFSERILRLLDAYSISPSLLEIEVTESIVMNEIQVVVSALNTLREAGVRIAIDDFGTGYSSLSYLQDLPLDVLKIDRSFINRLESERKGESVANTIMLLAKGLGLETVAEGVETRVQFRQVQQLGCKMIQGYYFAKPCSIEELVDTISAIHLQFDQARLKIV